MVEMATDAGLYRMIGYGTVDNVTLDAFHNYNLYVRYWKYAPIIINREANMHTTSVSSTIRKGVPCPICEWLICKSTDSC